LSISLSLYEQLFCAKELFAVFAYLQFMFAFWQNNIDRIVALIIFVKLTKNARVKCFWNWLKWSISSTWLYESLFGSFFYLHVTREKLQKRHSYEKFVGLTLMKLTQGVNFINVERTNFSYEYDVLATFLVTFWLWQKIRTKNACVKCWWNWLKVAISKRIISWVQRVRLFNRHRQEKKENK